jgi:hypothetical protein
MTPDQVKRLLRWASREELMRLLGEPEPIDPEDKDEWRRRLMHAGASVAAQLAAHSAAQRANARKPKPRGERDDDGSKVSAAQIVAETVRDAEGEHAPEELLNEALAALKAAGMDRSRKYVKELLSLALKDEEAVRSGKKRRPGRS